MTEYCTPEETLERVEICKTCESFVIGDTGTSCKECVGGCSVSLLVSERDQTCPKGKW